jgi:hypothetical protein
MKRDSATMAKKARTESFGRFIGSRSVYGVTISVTTVTAVRINVPNNFLLRVSNMCQEYLITLKKGRNPAPTEVGTGFQF